MAKPKKDIVPEIVEEEDVALTTENAKEPEDLTPEVVAPEIEVDPKPIRAEPDEDLRIDVTPEDADISISDAYSESSIEIEDDQGSHSAPNNNDADRAAAMELAEGAYKAVPDETRELTAQTLHVPVIADLVAAVRYLAGTQLSAAGMQEFKSAFPRLFE